MKINSSYNDLVSEIKAIISTARVQSVRNINSMQVLSNFLIGRRIIQFEQDGKERAGYGKETLRKLSDELTKEFGRGYSKSNIEYMRKFFLLYSGRLEEKTQTPSGQLEKKKTQNKSGESEKTEMALSDKITGQMIIKHLPLSWSHYVFLMGVKNEKERTFYEIESANANWSLNELKRQFNSSLFERLALSKDKSGIKKMAEKGVVIEKPQDVIKNPFVLEFLGLDENTSYTETDLETAIIDKLETFLLELGKGFLFEARQKRFTFDEDHFFVDLVFYNRILRCYVLIDLKIGELKHQDLGQMMMYVNYFDRYVKLEHETPTIGIILCKKNKASLVEITLPENSNIRSAEYQLYLPSKEELKKQIEEAGKEFERIMKK